MFLETSMVFPFLPSELVVPFAAGLLVTSGPTLVAFALVAATGATIGSLFAYHVFGTAGATVAERYGEYVHVSQDEIDRSRRWFRRWGESSVLWGRLLPVLRSIISIPAGFTEMNRSRFTAYSFIGAFLFNVGVGLVVYYGKEQSLYSVVFDATLRIVTSGIDHLVAYPMVSLLGIGLCILGCAIVWRQRFWILEYE
ncbi:DedA family protein [Haladaptatus sp. CMAA 1911]|uniref:DedA family protein n=1 Tax=unclassified Haladaptatus TaxID=2622732 RepID=UPI003754C551